MSTQSPLHSRRRIVAGALGASAGVLGAPRLAGAATPVASPFAGGVIDTFMGPVSVPARAGRIVALDSYAVTTMADLGVTPVGIPELQLDTFLPEYQSVLAGSTTVGPYGEPDLEGILALEPDLILCISAPWGSDNYDALAAIAPTVIGDYQVADAWKALADLYATAAGRRDELQAVIDRYETDVATTHERFAASLAETVFAVALGWGNADGQFAIYYPDSPPGTVLTDLGVTWCALAAGKSGGSERISLERLGELADADVILTYGNEDGVAEESAQAMIDNPLFQALPAVTQGHLYIWRVLVPGSYGEARVLAHQVSGVLESLQGTAADLRTRRERR